MAKFFFDTNVLVYSVDVAFPEKREVVLDLIEKHAKAGDAAVSTQVLQEFYVAATRRLGIDPLVARQQVKDFQVFDVVQLTPAMVEEGIDQTILAQLVVLGWVDCRGGKNGPLRNSLLGRHGRWTIDEWCDCHQPFPGSVSRPEEVGQHY